MKKNVASQAVGAQMCSASDGSAFTSAVTVYVTGDAGVQAVGSVGAGACTHEGNGFHTYAPAQAETNYNHVAFTFIGTGAIPTTVQIYTSFPQTVDLSTGITAGTITTATNVTTVNGLAANVITAASIAADAITDAKVAADVTIASVTGAVGSVTGAVGSVTANVNAVLTNGAHGGAAATVQFGGAGGITSTLTGNVTGSIGSVTGAVGSVTGNVGGNVTGSVGSVVGAVGSVTGLTASDVGAIKAKTDSLTYTVAGHVDANVQRINDVLITGNGQVGTEFGV